MLEKVTLPSYTKGEEIMNSISHAAGILFSIFAMIFFIMNSDTKSSMWGSVVYSLSSIVLYFSSTIYHSVRKVKIKKIFRLIDHTAIFIMITGIVLGLNIITIFPVNKPLSVAGTVVSLVITIVGIVLTFVDQEKYKNVQIILYVAISCIAIFGAKTLYDTHEAAVPIIILMTAGGLVYGTGMVFYIISKKTDKKYIHGIFHLFVLAGSAIQFFAILKAI